MKNHINAAYQKSIFTICFIHFIIRYVVNAQAIIATKNGTQVLAACILLSLNKIVFLIQYKNNAAIKPHNIGEVTQEAAIFHIVPQDTASNHKAAIQAHITQPTIE
jgi:hypothetical protein